MTKVKKITVANLKAIAAFSADFGGCTAIITGGNNKGKSSFLRSLPDRLRGVKPEVILKKGEKEGFAEWELTTGEKFIWTFDGKKEKLSFITERNIKASVTKDLMTAYFPPLFDVDEFLNSAPAKQKATLQKLTGIDFTEIDRIYKAAYEERTWANKRLSEAKAKKVLVDPQLPAEVTPTDELEAEIASIAVIIEKRGYVATGIENKKTELKDNEFDIESLKIKISNLEKKNAQLNQDVVNGEQWLADQKNKPADKTILDAQLATIRATNKEVEANNLAKLAEIELTKIEQSAIDADAEVKRIEAEKLDVIKNASMPEGFGFSDEGITYNGFEFNKQSLSSSGVYIAALKLAALNLGEVKTLHFDASFLDKNSLAEIEQWAIDNDLQLLIERPDFQGGEIEYQLIQTI